MTVTYVGVHYDGCHDSTVSVLTDKVEFVGQEERFSRQKKDGRPPVKAFENLNTNFRHATGEVRYVFPILDPAASDAEWAGSDVAHQEWAKGNRHHALKYAYSLTDSPIFVRHHDAHAASAYFTSGFQGKTLVCTADCGNFFDPYSTNLYEGDNGKLKAIKRVPSIEWALRYTIVTAMLGFKPIEHEGKITGLAAYGKYNESLIRELEEIFATPEGLDVLSLENLGDHEKVPVTVATEGIKIYGPIVGKYSKEDIAFAIQYITERDIQAFLEPYVGQYENIALAGGIFANVKINSKIKDMGFKNIFIHPAMGDDGLALGAALYAKSMDQLLLPFRLNDVYFSSAYTLEQVRAAVNSSGLKYTVEKDIESEIARVLKEGKIVARFAGRGEYGPRALGHRSILCRADDPEVNDHLNGMLRRTEFMPFAPVVTDYQAPQLFVGLEGAEYAASFMTITRECTNLMKRIGRGAVHVDGTARPQIVKPETDQSYYRILDAFYNAVGGQAVLVNTSFNMHGEPIVETPDEAIRSFLASGIDYLAIEDMLVIQPQ